MALKKSLEQHIAVFGESGSGKTVLISSFYGAAQEHQNIHKDGYRVIAENPTQGVALDRNYLEMKNSARPPVLTKFAPTVYKFRINLKAEGGKGSKSNAFDALRLVWHDYPGEWFEEDVKSEEEAQRRLTTFRDLLRSDVALLVVDGHRLLENAGGEARYLKSLLNNYRNQLLHLKKDLLVNDQPLVKFPRIWIMALTKSDLLPDLSVKGFKDLVVQNVADDLRELRDAIAELVVGDEALAVGEDFVLLSSAKFEGAKILVEQRKGLDLILPLAAILPFQRHMRWAESMNLPRKLVLDLTADVEEVAIAIGAFGAFISKLVGSKYKFIGTIGVLLSRVGPEMITWARGMLTEADRAAMAKQSRIASTLLKFEDDLTANEEHDVLQLSRR